MISYNLYNYYQKNNQITFINHSSYFFFPILYTKYLHEKQVTWYFQFKNCFTKSKTSIYYNMIPIGFIIIFGMTLIYIIYNILHDSLITMNFRTGFEMENHDSKLILFVSCYLFNLFCFVILVSRRQSDDWFFHESMRHFLYRERNRDVNHHNCCKPN